MPNGSDVKAGAVESARVPPAATPGREQSLWRSFRIDRVELAGSFGDLGTLLPIVVGMILINKLSPTTVFLSFGLFYGSSGISVL